MAINEDKIIINVVAQVNDSELNSGLRDIKKEVDVINKSDDLDIKIKTTVDNVNSASSLQDLKASLRELQGLALQVGDSNQEALNKINIAAGQAKDKIGDLRDGFNSLSGSNIENVSSSFASLKQKMVALDLDGVKQQFGNLTTSLGGVAKSLGIVEATAEGVGITLKGAFIASGIGALVLAVITLVTHFDDLKKSGGLLGTTLKSVAGIVGGLTSAMTALTDAIGLTAIASQKAADAQIEDQKRVSSSLKSEYEYRLALLKAQGKDTSQFELDELKKTLKEKEAILDGSQKSIIGGINKYINAQIKSGATETEEYKKFKKDKLDEIDLIKKSIAIKEAEITTSNKKSDKKADKSNSINETAEKLKRLQELNDLEVAKTKEGSLERLKAVESGLLKEQSFYENLSKKQLDDLKISDTQRQIIVIGLQNDRLKANKDYYDIEDKLYQKSLDEQLSLKQKQIDDQAALDKISSDNFKAGIQLNLETYRNAEEEYDKLMSARHQKIIDGLQAVSSSFSDLGSQVSDINNIASSVLTGFGSLFSSITDSFSNFKSNVADFVDSGKNGMSEATATIIAGVQAGLEAAQSVIGTIGDVLKNVSDNNIKQNDNETKKKLKNLDQRAKTEKLTEDQIAKAKYLIQLDSYNKDLELRRKAFKQQKAIQITQAVIGTAQGVVAALANPFPLNIVMAALAGVVGATNIGLIAAQKFPEGDGPPSAPTPAPIPTPSDVSNQSEKISSQGPDNKFIAPQFFGLGGKQLSDSQETYQKVYVVESDITRMQKKVNVIEDRARIGG